MVAKIIAIPVKFAAAVLDIGKALYMRYWQAFDCAPLPGSLSAGSKSRVNPFVHFGCGITSR